MPPMLKFGLEFLGFSTWHFLKLVFILFCFVLLHVISHRCVARDLHTTAHGLGYLSVCVGDSVRRSEGMVKNLKLHLSMLLLLFC